MTARGILRSMASRGIRVVRIGDDVGLSGESLSDVDVALVRERKGELLIAIDERDDELSQSKERFNAILGRERKAEKFFDDETIPRRQKLRSIPSLVKMLDGLAGVVSELVDAGLYPSRDELLAGFTKE
jgi:hypothetical protein